MADRTSALPSPENWPAGWRRFLRVKAGLVILALVMLFVAVPDLVTGNVLEGLVAVGFFAGFGSAVFVLLRVSHGGVRIRAVGDSTGTTLRADETSIQLGLFAIAVFIAAGVNCVVGALRGDMPILLALEPPAVVVGAAAVGTLIAAGALFAAWRRGGAGHIQLTPTGIDFTDLKHSVAVVSVPWDDLVGIADHVKSSDGPQKTIVLRLKDKTRQTIDDADLYAPNGYALYWMVRHYLRHPEDRPELTDGRAIERLHAGRFDVPVP